VYEIQEDQKVRLASLEFLDYVMQWWHKVVMDIWLNKRSIMISWDDLKLCTRAVCFSLLYEGTLVETPTPSTMT